MPVFYQNIKIMHINIKYLVFLIFILNFFLPGAFSLNSKKIAPEFLGYSLNEDEPFMFIQDKDTCADSVKLVITSPIIFKNEMDLV